MKPAKRFFKKALVSSYVSQPRVITVDKNLAYPVAIQTLKEGIYSGGYSTVRWEPEIDQNTRLELMAKGHVLEESSQHIGNIQAVIFDYENGKMYGEADNTREGTVLGVDAVSYKSKEPRAIKEEEKGPFTFKVNGNVYPYTAKQMKIIDGRPFIQSDKLLLGLGVIESTDLEIYKSDKTSYLPVIKVAESLGYKVNWREEEKVVLLEEDASNSDSPNDDEDGDIITK